MTTKEYEETLDELRADFSFCFRTGNNIEANRIIRDAKEFIRTNKDNLENGNNNTLLRG